MAIKRYKFEGDFETTTEPSDVRVWASGLVNIDTLETSFVGNDIESFFDFLKNKNSDVYMHNLKFDGEFILSYLLTNGYKYSEKREPMTFDALITDDGLFYQITVIFEKKNKKYKKVVFYDSYKKLPFKVSVIAKAFELADQKGEIDYTAHREKGHQLTENERDYLIKDCRIVAEALRIQFSKGLKKMTNASDAMASFKEIIGKDNFRRWFPELPLLLDSDIRRAYKGGFTYLNPRYKNKRVQGGITLDVNSLYPWAMYYCMLPYGYPIFFEGKYKHDKNYPLYIVHMKCCFKLKADHIPCLQLKNNRRFVETEYLTSSVDEMGIDEPVELYLTNVDYQLLIDHYDIWDETYINGWKFKGVIGMFKGYIDFWMNIKETTTGAMRQLAKLMLNSLYGKFASNPYAYKKVPYLEDGVVKFEPVRNEETAKKYGIKPPEPREPVYTALACFVTAYAREKTIRSAQSVYNRFIYADTDSLHLEGFDIPEGLEIHSTKLGAWKHEGEFVDSVYIRAKTYLEQMKNEAADTLENYARLLSNNYQRQEMGVYNLYRQENSIEVHDVKVTCAGMPDNVKEVVTFANFQSGSTFDGKLMPRRYKGGIVLEPTTFTIK